jgi:hypothetical protein
MSGLAASFSGLSHAANCCRAARLMIAAPFSAIMMVGALVLVELTAGTYDGAIPSTRTWWFCDDGRTVRRRTIIPLQLIQARPEE